MFETLPPSITIQGRMERIITGRPATWHIGLAFRETDQSFEVSLIIIICIGYTLKYMINQVTGTNTGPTGWRIAAESNNLTDIELPLASRWPDDITSLVQLQRDRTNNLIVDFFTSGISLIISLKWYNNRNYFSYNVKVPTSYMSKVQGLLGNFDGSLTFELFTKANESVPYTSDQGVYCAMTSCKQIYRSQSTIVF